VLAIYTEGTHMPTNLTGNTIASTFDQLLHVDDGPTATEKTVYSGTGVATALKVGTESVSVENIQLDGNTIRTLDTNGNLNLSPNGTGSVAMTKVAITGGTISGITDLAIADGGTGASTAADARTNLGLGTMATQAASAVAITGGSISGVTFSGSFSGMTLVEATTLATSAAAAGVNLNGNTLSADGTDTNIDINITPKGTGEVNVTNIDVVSGKVPFNTITNRAYASFFDAGTTDQTANAARRGGNNLPFAWANYLVGFGLGEQYGVSGVTVVGTGDFTFTLSRAMNSTDVCPVVQGRFSSAAPGFFVATVLSTTQIQVKCYNSAGVAADPQRIYFSLLATEN
jgi:hypothetical protein